MFTASATCQYLKSEGVCAADPGAAWSAVLALERAGLLAIDAAGTPPAVWMSPALQAAVRAAAPPDLLNRAARAAADALARGVARRSAAIVAGRGPAVIRREPAAGHR